MHFPNDWSELEKRLLPHKQVITILSIYAFHTFGITHLSLVINHTSKRARVYKCSTCPDESYWSVCVKLVHVNDDEKMWHAKDGI